MTSSIPSIPSKDLQPTRRARSRPVVVLFKLRVVWLLLFAAIGGAFMAAGGLPKLEQLLVLIIAGGLTAAGASALNQFLEQNSDALMTRTQRRPLVTGKLAHPNRMRGLAIGMTVVPGLLVLPVKPILALFLWLGAFVYLVIYTIWLKPRTPLNIVVGGAAGSAAVLCGAAAVGDWNHTGALVLALLVFLWTPTHFWSLAILYRDDYRASRIPMLPATVAPRAAAGWVMLHTAATALSAVALATHPELGWLYAAPVILATGLLLFQSLQLVLRPEPRYARALFIISNIYLGLVLLCICLDVLL